jgi:hypothetical protein
MEIAGSEFVREDFNNIFLSYQDASQVFINMKDEAKLGICMNNIGCLLMRMGDLNEAIRYFKGSIAIQTTILKSSEQIDSPDYLRDRFVMAYRSYHLAYCLSLLIKNNKIKYDRRSKVIIVNESV